VVDNAAPFASAAVVAGGLTVGVALLAARRGAARRAAARSSTMLKGAPNARAHASGALKVARRAIYVRDNPMSPPASRGRRHTID
jgi:hypothetical protein